MDLIKERAEAIGQYICETHATVRDTAKRFGISKSTVHKDITQKLPGFSPALFAGVRNVLEENKAERHLRGGEATKQKYLMLHRREEDAKHEDEFFKR